MKQQKMFWMIIRMITRVLSLCTFLRTNRVSPDFPSQRPTNQALSAEINRHIFVQVLVDLLA